MSYRYYILAKRISRRIKLKEEYLQLFLPNPAYLEFIQVLEIFQAQVQGVYGERVEKDFVELQTIKDKFTEINRLYKLTKGKITNIIGYLKNSEPTVILREFHGIIDSCKLYLNNTWISFSREIELLGRNIYNIKILSRIDNSLDSIRSQIKVLTLNLNNVKYSTQLNEVKSFLELTYKAALSCIKTRYANLKRLFPNTFTVSRLTMSKQTKENDSKDDINLAERCENSEDFKESFDLINCLAVDPCTCNAPKVPEKEEAEVVCSTSSSEESPKRHLNENNITEEYENQISQRKIALQNVMNDLLSYSREISRIENSIYMKEADNDVYNNCYLKEKLAIENNVKLSSEEKQQKLKLIDCQMFHKNEKLQQEKKTLEDKIVYIRKKARCQLKELKHLVKVFSLEHTRMIDYLEKFKLKALCPILLEQKIEILQKNFKCEMGRIWEYYAKISNLYEGNEDISDKSTESWSSSLLSKTSTSKEDELLEVVDVKNDNEMYIKHVLGKALVQGLAQITVVQPTDPIYYLANYLMHYRYNELSNLKKQVAFEELLIERERCSKIKEGQPICNPCGYEDKDPCK